MTAPAILVPVSPIIGQITASSSLSVNGVARLLNPSADVELLIWEIYYECVFGPIGSRIKDNADDFTTAGGATVVTATNPQRLDERDTDPIIGVLESSNLPPVSSQFNFDNSIHRRANEISPNYEGLGFDRLSIAYPVRLPLRSAYEIQLPATGSVNGRFIFVWDEIAAAGGPT